MAVSNGDDAVLPADDESFSSFKKMCENNKDWSVCYDKKNVTVSTQQASNSNIKILKVSL